MDRFSLRRYSRSRQRSEAAPRLARAAAIRGSGGGAGASRGARGFTLIEVLVALAILGLALAAVLHTMGQSIDIATDLRARTLALWVAEERATEHQLRGEWPQLDTTEGTMTFAGDEWRWREHVSATQTPFGETRRIDIEILAPDSPDILARLAVFFSRP